MKILKPINFLIGLVAFSLTFLNNSSTSFAAEEVNYLSTDSIDIVITDELPVQFKIYPSDLGIFDTWNQKYRTAYRALYFNGTATSIGSPNSDTEYAYSVRSLGPRDNYYLVEVNPNVPFRSGTYPLVIDLVHHQKLFMNITILGENPPWEPYGIVFEAECKTFFYNEPLKCSVSSDFSAMEEEDEEQANLLVGRFKVTYFFRSSPSGKWVKKPTFSWDIQEGVVSTFERITKPLEVKIGINFLGESYNIKPFTVYPKPKLVISSTNAAIVGQNFYLNISTTKNYSGKCYANSQIEFKIRNGFARVSVYGKTPGNLEIYITCQSKNWADSSAYKFVFIRS